MNLQQAPGCPQTECTLCMACKNVCQADAIKLTTDDYGYEALVIEPEKCIHCHACEVVCGKRKQVSCSEPIECYAGQHNIRADLVKSASGGAVQAFAQQILDEHGVCYGCKLEYEDGVFSAKHIRVDSIENLQEILNSKYIPSVIGDTYKQAKSDLKAGLRVLYIGTPCQIQGLRACLGDNTYSNLLTVDVICHGIPSATLFNQFIHTVNKLDRIEIYDYIFRDKDVSWGTNYAYRYKKNGRNHIKHCPREFSSFMAMYLNGVIFRNNCYHCSLASKERVSDITCGDYWNVELEHPEFVTDKKQPMSLRGGVGCILVNSEKGREYVSKIQSRMALREVSFNSIAKHNASLRVFAVETEDRKKLLETIRSEGYESIEMAHRKSIAKRMLVYRLKNTLKTKLPDRLRLLLYRKMMKG